MQEENSRKRYRLFSSLPENYHPESKYFMGISLEYGEHYNMCYYSREEDVSPERIQKVLAWIKLTHAFRKSLANYIEKIFGKGGGKLVLNDRSIEEIIRRTYNPRQRDFVPGPYLTWVESQDLLLLEIWLAGKAEIADRETVYKHRLDRTTTSLFLKQIVIGREIIYKGRHAYEYMINEEWKSI